MLARLCALIPSTAQEAVNHRVLTSSRIECLYPAYRTPLRLFHRKSGCRLSDRRRTFPPQALVPGASQAQLALLDLPPQRGSLPLHSVHILPSTLVRPSEQDFWWAGSFYVLEDSLKL